MIPLLSIRIDHERDVVTARRRGWQLAEMLGFDLRERTQIATSVSEIARNAYGYAGGGRMSLTVEGADSERMLVATVTDNGPGIPNLAEILGGRYQSQTGMGLGIIGARRL